MMTRELRAALAVRAAAVKVERAAQRAAWKCREGSEQDLLECIMREIAVCITNIKACGEKYKDGKGDGPPCPVGFQEEYGICVPQG